MAKLRFAVPDDQAITVAARNLLDELNNTNIAISDDIVANIASRHGFECSTLTPGIFTLSYRTRELDAFLVQGAPTALTNKSVFELFIGVSGVHLA